MRMVSDSAAVVTPISAARSKRGLMVISGRRLSPSMRGWRSCGRPRISSTILVGRGFEQDRIAAGKHHGDVAPAAAAVLRLEIDAGIGNCRPVWAPMQRSNSTLVDRAVVRQREENRGAADLDIRKGRVDDRRLFENGGRPVRRRPSVCASVEPGGSAIVHLAEIGIVGRLEGKRQGRKGDDRADQGAAAAKRRRSSSGCAATSAGRACKPVHPGAFAMFGVAMRFSGNRRQASA